MAVDSSTIPLALQIPDIPYHIRMVRQADISELRKNCWAHRSIASCRELLKTVTNSAEKGRGLGVVVETASHELPIIAYGQALVMPKCAEISDLVVAEGYRSQGIGTAIVQYLIHNIRETGVRVVEIGVAASNPRAFALYQHLGFKITYDLTLNLGNGRERVIYLRLNLPEKQV